MSKDYKPRPQKSNGKAGSFTTGLLIGFLLGVAAATTLTIYLKGDLSPFEDKKINAPVMQSLDAKKSKNNNGEAAENKDDADKNNYDFYTILPENESTVTEKEIKDNRATIQKDSYFLQTGAFQDENDADNMKAKLALQGFEAVVQTANVPDKGVWHRVRVGPLSDIDQINKTRNDLTQNGFHADLIKIHTESKS